MKTQHSLNRIGWIFAAIVASWPIHAQTPDEVNEPKLVAGWLEDIVLVPFGARLRAKLDTGAKTSSIHAAELHVFERKDETWVRFTTRDRRRNDGDHFTIERPLLRTVKIKRHSRPPVERPVIGLEFCLNKKLYRADFTLTDRGTFNYPVLLGRRFLAQGIVVDPSVNYTQKTRRKACLKKAKGVPNPPTEEDTPRNVP